VPLDCEGPTENWPDALKRWCCDKHSIGCTTTVSAPFRCDGDAVDEEEAEWCCEIRGVRCSAPAAVHKPARTARLRPPFLCNDEEQMIWSGEERRWCCDRQPALCDTEASRLTSTPAPYDCLEKLSTLRTSWDPEKKAWCCEFKGRGCPPLQGEALPVELPATTTTWDFTCRAETPADIQAWPLTERVFCCLERGIGCGERSPKGEAIQARVEDPVEQAQLFRDCFAKGVLYEERSGSQAPVTTEASTWHCQALCAQTTSCSFFSFWTVSKRCYHYGKDVEALQLQEGGHGDEFVSGPAVCTGPTTTTNTTTTGTATTTTTSSATATTKTFSTTSTSGTTTTAGFELNHGSLMRLVDSSPEETKTTTTTTTMTTPPSTTSTEWAVPGFPDADEPFPELENKFLGPQAPGHIFARLPLSSILVASLAACGIACSVIAFGSCRHASRSGALHAEPGGGHDGAFGAVLQLQRLQHRLTGGDLPSAREYHALQHHDDDLPGDTSSHGMSEDRGVPLE